MHTIGKCYTTHAALGTWPPELWVQFCCFENVRFCEPSNDEIGSVLSLVGVVGGFVRMLQIAALKFRISNHKYQF